MTGLELETRAEVELEAARELVERVGGRSENRAGQIKSDVRGDVWVRAREQERTFRQGYERSVDSRQSESAERIEERLEGGVDYRAEIEEQKIVGGPTPARTAVRGSEYRAGLTSSHSADGPRPIRPGPRLPPCSSDHTWPSPTRRAPGSCGRPR